MNSFNFFAVIALLFFFEACATVNIPKKDNDQAPQVTLEVVNQTLHTSYNYTADASLSVSPGTVLQFISSAYNSKGGVQDLKLFVPVSNPLPYETTAAPDASGKVPVELFIALANNAQITQAETLQGSQQLIKAVATNFNQQPASVTVTVNVNYNPPVVQPLSFDADPNRWGSTDGYINIGQSTHLHYAVQDCNGCTITLTAYNTCQPGLLITSQLFQVGLPAPSGTFLVKPTLQWTNYSVTATSSYGTSTKTICQQIYIN